MIYKTGKQIIVVVFLSVFAISHTLFAEDIAPEVLVEKAKVQFVLKKYNNANDLAKEAIKREPDNTEALLVIAQSAYILGRYEEAKDSFERLFQKEPERKKEYLKDYGIVLFAMGENSTAEKILREALSNEPEDSVTGFTLGSILYKDKRYSEAEKILSATFNKKDDFFIPTGVILAEIYDKTGKTEDAQNVVKLLEKERMGEVSSQIVESLSSRLFIRKEYYKKLSLEFSVGAGYDSNAVFFTESEKTEGLTKESLFSQVYFDMVYNPYITATRRLYLSMNLMKSYNFEEDAKQFDKLLINPKLGYKFYMGFNNNTYVDAGYEYFNNFFSGGERVGFNDFDWYYQSNSLFVEAGNRFGKSSVFSRYSFSFSEFENHNRSNFGHRVLLAVSHNIHKSSIYIGLLGGFEDARLNLFDNLSFGGMSGVFIELIKNLTLAGSVSFEKRNYFDNQEDRKDNQIVVGSRLEYNILQKYFINFSTQYVNNDSSLKRYSIDKVILSLNTGFYY